MGRLPYVWNYDIDEAQLPALAGDGRILEGLPCLKSAASLELSSR